jgi:hypothetical protein
MLRLKSEKRVVRARPDMTGAQMHCVCAGVPGATTETCLIHDAVYADQDASNQYARACQEAFAASATFDALTMAQRLL